MDHVILHIPRIKTILLNDILRKEEESYCSLSRTFSYQIWTKDFFKRINELQKFLNENYNFEILSDKKDYILKFIEEFKNEHYRKVMKENIYSNYLLLLKNKKSEKYGICGWIPKFYRKYKITLEDKTYEEKLYYCHLSDDEKNFNFAPKVKKFDFLSLFFREECFYDNQYNIPTNDIIRFKRKYIIEIRNKCCKGNIVCPIDHLCDGHKFIHFLEKIFEAMTYSVMEKKVFYKYFLFNNIEKKNNEIFSWDFIAAEPKDISNLSYSKRLAFLN